LILAQLIGWYSRILESSKIERTPEYHEAVRKIYSLLDDKLYEEAEAVAKEHGISGLEFEGLKTSHFWGWDND
jgi:hypothetical protein